jgi:hypothetical protein
MGAGAGLSLSASLGMGAVAEAADFRVTNLNDAGAGSLRQAVLGANLAPTADRVLFRSGLSGQITLTTGQISIYSRLRILGPGADKLTVSGGNASRVFYADVATPGTPVTVSGLTIADGMTGGTGGGIYNYDAGMTVSKATVTGNTAGGDGAGINSYSGSFTLQSSTVSANNSGHYGGGFEWNGPGTLTIERSTISGNQATEGPGGLNLPDGEGTAAIRNTTIAANSSTNPNYSNGIYLSQPVTLVNSIVADSTGGDPANPEIQIASGSLSASFSLIEDPTGVTIGGGPNITGQDPKLGPLASNGGPTQTRALLPGSPALDAGRANGLDQRGAPRPFDLAGVALAGDNQADIGAYERVLCAGRLVRLVGTAGKDRLVGTSGPEGILGLGGKDLLIGRGGADSLCGGGGADTLRGGNGRDRLLGQAGRDKLRGGGGRDVLRGGPGRDQQRQ